jgi:F-type H+-transporting ATPase subunit gamma
MKSIENIHEITKAMEMIAAFRFKKAENRYSRSKTYLLEMEKLVANISGAVAERSGSGSGQVFAAQALFEKRTVRKKALVVITGDKGLCGAYNANLLRTAFAWLNENKVSDPCLVPVGKVGCEAMRKRRLPVLASYPEKTSADLALARKITEELKNAFIGGRVDSVELLYTSYRTGAAGQNHVTPFLGLDHLMESGNGQSAAVDFICEPDLDTLFSALLSRYLEGKIYLSLLESLTSEYSARRVAMKQATENGEEVLDSLKLLRNKTRQATITRELSEIVSGASVLV